jgi:hypothetical protein
MNTLEVALEHIKELEAENRKLLSELEYYDELKKCKGNSLWQKSRNQEMFQLLKMRMEKIL